jgi:hypothetical protein
MSLVFINTPERNVRDSTEIYQHFVKSFQKIYGVGAISLKSGKYLPYGFGELYDSFPQFLVYCAKNSGTLFNAINKKATLLKGAGFEHDYLIEKECESLAIQAKEFKNQGNDYDAQVIFDKIKTLKSTKIGSKVINSKKETLNDLLEKICIDLVQFEGLGLHFNYNLFGQICEINHIDFEKVRQGEQPYYVAVLHRFDKYRSKKSETLIEYFDAYNPNSEVIRKQINRDGLVKNENGKIEMNFKGQVYYYFLSRSGARQYPYPVYGPVLQDAENEFQISVSKKSDIIERFKAQVIITKYGNANPDDLTRENDEAIFQNFSGPDGGRVLLQYADNPQSKPDATVLTTPDMSASYQYAENSIKTNIRTAFDLPEEFYSFTGKSDFLGDSDKLGKLLDFVQKTVLIPTQQKISEMLEEIFSHYKDDINPSKNFRIQNLGVKE